MRKIFFDVLTFFSLFFFHEKRSMGPDRRRGGRCASALDFFVVFFLTFFWFSGRCPPRLREPQKKRDKEKQIQGTGNKDANCGS